MIKVGIIGAGRIGHVHGESISKFVKNASVKTIADPFMNDKIAWLGLSLSALKKSLRIIAKFSATRKLLRC